MIYSDWPETDAQFLFDFDKNALIKSWDKLHLGNKEPLPSASLIDGWCDFHNGLFASSAEKGAKAGPEGAVLAVSSIVAYTDYICEDDSSCEQWLEHAIEIAELALEQMPEKFNHHFCYALAAGRYSQQISIVKAIRKGLAGKVKSALEETLKLEETHAEAHTALALYHAEIIDKIGSTIGGLTYGAKASKAHNHFARSLSITPNSAIALIEKGNGLILLEGDDAMDKATELYQQASQCKPLDCLQALDIDFAQSQLEE